MILSSSSWNKCKQQRATSTRRKVQAAEERPALVASSPAKMSRGADAERLQEEETHLKRVITMYEALLQSLSCTLFEAQCVSGVRRHKAIHESRT